MPKTISVGLDKAISILTRVDGVLPAGPVGAFQIIINGATYGLSSHEATLLACSFDEIKKRYAERGTHTPAFDIERFHSHEIATNVLEAIYTDSEKLSFLGVSRDIFVDNLYEQSLIWAPDGDQAFDDGSVVLQFDLSSRIKLIAFKNVGDFGVPSEVEELTLAADSFYELLGRWISAFENGVRDI